MDKGSMKGPAASTPVWDEVSRADTELARIITLYDPNPDEWDDYSRRR